MNVKTSELTGAALDWAVAKADDEEWPQVYAGYVYVNGPKRNALAMRYCPSTSWSQGGPLADKFNVDFNTQGVDEDGGQLIEATVQDFGTMQCWAAEGDTRLAAVCRAIVLSKLGDEVDVPAELLAVTGENVYNQGENH